MILQLLRRAGVSFGLLFLVCLRLGATTSPTTIATGDRPGWFTAAPLDLAAESRQPHNPEASNSGLEFLLLDRQIDVATAASTTHIVFRVTSQAGLSSGAQISESFDPTYETLTYHFVRVWREGVAQDRLVVEEFKILQQERDLDRQLYNGTLSALLLLRDIRVGDIIEYSRTSRGANPVFAGKFIDTQSFGWASPLRHQRLRLLVPPGRRVFSKLHGEGLALHETTQPAPGGGTEFSWESRAAKPIEANADAPAWFVQYPYLELSEFPDWAAVVTWAQPLYQLPPPNAAVREKAAALAGALSTPEAKALALLDFVQRDVRYLGIELGPNSHQPHQPTEVLARRFGDCKDKVFLLCALLEAVGLRARPVLVNTYETHHTDHRLPGPYAFNHVIAAIDLPQKTYLVDPTRSYQRGPLAGRGLAEATKGLFIEPTGASTAALSAGPVALPLEPAAAPKVVVDLTYSMKSYTEPTLLAVNYFFTGTAAENMRYYLANGTREAITRDYLDSLKRGHPNLTHEHPITWNDDEARNQLTLTLDVTVKDLWKFDQDEGVYQTEFYPWSLYRFVVQPETLTRRSPLSLDHPTDTSVSMTVHFHDEWALQNTTDQVSTPWYDFNLKTMATPRSFVMSYHWKSKSDHVPLADLQTHLTKLEEIRSHTGYTLTHNTRVSERLKTYAVNWIMVTVAVITVIAWLGFAIWINTRPPAATPPLLADQKLAGINGWLILVAIGVLLSPFTLIASVVDIFGTYFDQRVWLTFTSSDYTTYQPVVAVFLVGELVSKISLIALSLVIVVLFFREKRQLPAVMITFLAAAPVFLIGDLLSSNALGLTGDEELEQESYLAILRAVAGAVIWIPYFCTSRRVKATFTR